MTSILLLILKKIIDNNVINKLIEYGLISSLLIMLNKELSSCENIREYFVPPVINEEHLICELCLECLLAFITQGIVLISLFNMFI